MKRIYQAIRDFFTFFTNIYSSLTKGYYPWEQWNISYALSDKFMRLTNKKQLDQWCGFPGTDEANTMEKWKDIIKEMRFYFFYNSFVKDFGVYWNSLKERKQVYKDLLKKSVYREEIEFYWYDLTFTTWEEDWKVDFGGKKTEDGNYEMILEYVNIHTFERVPYERFRGIRAIDLFIKNYEDRAKKGGELFSKWLYYLWD